MAQTQSKVHKTKSILCGVPYKTPNLTTWETSQTDGNCYVEGCECECAFVPVQMNQLGMFGQSIVIKMMLVTNS